MDEIVPQPAYSPLPKSPGIYKIYFLDPNLIYIGSSVNLRKRRRDHLYDLRKGIHRNSHLQRAYVKYGNENFHFEIVEHVERREDLIHREQYYLDLLAPYYNINPTANVPPVPSPERRQRISQMNKGRRMSLEARAKMSKAKKGKPNGRKGLKLSEAHRAKLRGKKRSEEANAKNRAFHLGRPPGNKGKPMSMEQRQKLSEIKKGKPAGWNKGKERTPEHRAKLSAAGKGHIPWNKGRKSDKPPWNKGKPASPEVIAKMADAKRGTHLSPEVHARFLERRRATLARKKAKNQPSLWDEDSLS